MKWVMDNSLFKVSIWSSWGNPPSTTPSDNPHRKEQTSSTSAVSKSFQPFSSFFTFGQLIYDFVVAAKNKLSWSSSDRNHQSGYTKCGGNPRTARKKQRKMKKC